VAGIEKNYGLKIPNPDAAREMLHTVNTIAAAIEAHRGSGSQLHAQVSDRGLPQSAAG
jgi:hypothetical protein